MNSKTTLILAVLLIAGGLLWLFKPGVSRNDAAQTEEKRPSETRDVFDPRPAADDIVRVIIEREGKPRLAFERSGEKDPSTNLMDDWRMSEPIPAATENWNVQGVVTSVIGLQSTGSFKPGGTGGVSLAEAGLEKPLGTIRLIDKNAKEYRVDIGKKPVMSNDTYVRVDGRDEVLVVTRDFSTDLKNDVAHYRGKQLFKNANRNAVRLAVEHDGKRFSFAAKEGSDEWIMDSPARAYAVPDKVRGIINAMARVRVDKFVDDAPASLEPFGFDPPYLRVTLTTEEKKTVAQSQPAGAEPSTQPAEPKTETITRTFALLVGGFADAGSTTRFIKLPDQPWVATASKDTIESLAPKDVRDTRVTRVKADAVTQIALTTGEASATLHRQDGRWTGEGELTNIDEEAVKNLLQAVEDARAIDFVDAPESPEKYGLDSPRATIRLTTAGAVEPTALRIGANTPSARNTYVQVAGQESVLVISADLAGRLAIDPQSLRSRAIFSFKPDDIRQIERIRAGTRMVLVRDAFEWKLTEPQAPADPAGTRELANDLALLRARRILGAVDPASHGLDEPLLTIRFTLETAPPAPAESDADAETPPPPPTPETHTLYVGRVANMTFARRDGDATVFELDETVFRTLTGELIRRQLFDGVFTAADVVGIKISGNNQPAALDFVRDGKDWKYQIDPSVKVVAKKVDDFAAELAAMRAESYIAYDDADVDQLGLGSAIEATITLRDDRTVTLKVDPVRRGEMPRAALWVEQRRAFLLRPGDAERLIRGIDWYVKPDAPESPD